MARIPRTAVPGSRGRVWLTGETQRVASVLRPYVHGWTDRDAEGEVQRSAVIRVNDDRTADLTLSELDQIVESHEGVALGWAAERMDEWLGLNT